MKKIFIMFSIACVWASAIAQPAVRIGNMEIIVRKQDQDTTMQVNVFDDPCPPCPPNGEIYVRPRERWIGHRHSSGFGGFGFALPDNSNSVDYYTILGGNSISLEGGWVNRLHLSRRLALVGTLQGSYYNFRLHDIIKDQSFIDEVLEGKDFSADKVEKQLYRTHNFAAAAGVRFYLAPPNNRYSNRGVFIEAGMQGDYALRRICRIHTESTKNKFFNNYAFSPFTVSAVARVGFRSFAIFARYRVTDAFNPNIFPKDLPPASFGVHFY